MNSNSDTWTSSLSSLGVLPSILANLLYLALIMQQLIKPVRLITYLTFICHIYQMIFPLQDYYQTKYQVLLLPSRVTLSVPGVGHGTKIVCYGVEIITDQIADNSLVRWSINWAIWCRGLIWSHNYFLWFIKSNRKRILVNS